MLQSFYCHFAVIRLTVYSNTPQYNNTSVHIYINTHAHTHAHMYTSIINIQRVNSLKTFKDIQVPFSLVFQPEPDARKRPTDQSYIIFNLFTITIKYQKSVTKHISRG